MDYRLFNEIAHPSLPRIGNLLGERNAKRAGVAARSSLLVALVFAGISRCVLFC